MDQVSSHEGAELPDDVNGVSFSDPAFWRELSSALGVANGHSTGLEEASDASSDISDPFDDNSESDDGGSDDNGGSHMAGDGLDNPSDAPQPSSTAFSGDQNRRQPNDETPASGGNGSPPSAMHDPPQQTPSASASRPNAAAEHSEQATASGSDAGRFHSYDGHMPWMNSASDILTDTDSDDEGYGKHDEASFAQAYDQVLSQQIAGSRVGNLLQPGLAESVAEQQHYTRPVGAAASRAQRGEEEVNELQPIDLDTNMVQNLLQSYAAQGGLAGPAGNLAGLLGLKLPDNVE